MTPFTRFIAIDWSGAKGERHASIAVAACRLGGGAPALIEPPPSATAPAAAAQRWSRAGVLDWLQDIAARGERALVGFDFSFGLPHADTGAFFPGDADNPANTRELWREVDAVADPHLEAHSYIDRRRRHYWLGRADGNKAVRARLREVERVWAAKKLGAASSVFALLGAAQCGKASLSGMRLLNRLALPVWPFDPVPKHGALVVEIYCRTFAADGGVRGKIRDRATLDAALARLGSTPATVPATFSDHVGDALVSAAGMRRAAADLAYWSPPGLSPALARTEGWTFGVA